ncbi:MAG: alpha/beta hydrolase family protein, partial [Terriglobia bacterium]
GTVIVTLTCEFEKGAIDLNVGVENKQVVRLNYFPNLKLAYKAPAYVKADAFREVEVTLNPGEWELPGTLTLPKGDGPFPAVVLVHGSGPQDRDEAIGPNQPFRDLAGGLASKGIAVLRYEKRTKHYAYKLTKRNIAITIKEEVIDDALAAVALLRTRKEIDAKQIYVLGHSLGGYLAPRIAEGDNKLAGLILLAGNSRPLTDLIVEQADYLMALPDTTNAHKAYLEDLKKQVERIKDPKLGEGMLKSERILDAPVAYWLSLRAYDAPATAAKLKVPMLVLQGERDYQVSMKDFEGWKKALKGRDNVRFKSYPKLNHLFVEGEGKSQPREYGEPGHISGAVLDDIVAWIK